MNTQTQFDFLTQKMPTVEEPTIVMRMVKQQEALQALLQFREEWRIAIGYDATIPTFILEHIWQDVARRILGFNENQVRQIFGLSLDELPRMMINEVGEAALDNRLYQ